MRCHPGRDLARVIGVTFGTFQGSVLVESLSCTPWASVTFAGARHELRVTLEGQGALGAASDFLAEMPEIDLPLRGHIVADLALIAEERRDGGDYVCLELEALTIEES